MIFIKIFNIPRDFQVFQMYSHFSRFSRSSGNPVEISKTANVAKWPSLLSWSKLTMKQCIPVGCVTATKCHVVFTLNACVCVNVTVCVCVSIDTILNFDGDGDTLPPLEGSWDQTVSDIISHGRNMVLDREWHHTQLLSWTEWLTHTSVWKHYLPLRSLKINCLSDQWIWTDGSSTWWTN